MAITLAKTTLISPEAQERDPRIFTIATFGHND